jgi:hypothetical protein
MSQALTLISSALFSISGFASSADVCQAVVENETLRFEAEAERADPDYVFNGIGDVYRDGDIYSVTIGYNEECQGGYEFTVKRSDDGRSCTILKTVKISGDCG